MPDEKRDTVRDKCITLFKNFMVFVLCKYRSCCGLSIGSASNARQHVGCDSVISDSGPLGYNIQGVPGGKDLTSGECSLGHTIPI